MVMRYSMDDIKTWIKNGEAVSPHVAKELLLHIGQLERKVSIATEFVLWLTPCGQDMIGPTQEVIGIEARDIYKRLTSTDIEHEENPMQKIGL